MNICAQFQGNRLIFAAAFALHTYRLRGNENTKNLSRPTQGLAHFSTIKEHFHYFFALFGLYVIIAIFFSFLFNICVVLIAYMYLGIVIIISRFQALFLWCTTPSEARKEAIKTASELMALLSCVSYIWVWNFWKFFLSEVNFT